MIHVHRKRECPGFSAPPGFFEPVPGMYDLATLDAATSASSAALCVCSQQHHSRFCAAPRPFSTQALGLRGS